MSADRSLPHDPLIPGELKTVSAMIEAGVSVMGCCDRCKRSCKIDLHRVQEKRGPYWTLFGRRLRCPTGVLPVEVERQRTARRVED